jgi:hypothetical protein
MHWSSQQQQLPEQPEHSPQQVPLPHPHLHAHFGSSQQQDSALTLLIPSSRLSSSPSPRLLNAKLPATPAPASGGYEAKHRLSKVIGAE